MYEFVKLSFKTKKKKYDKIEDNRNCLKQLNYDCKFTILVTNIELQYIYSENVGLCELLSLIRIPMRRKYNGNERWISLALTQYIMFKLS